MNNIFFVHGLNCVAPNIYIDNIKFKTLPFGPSVAKLLRITPLEGLASQQKLNRVRYISSSTRRQNSQTSLAVLAPSGSVTALHKGDKLCLSPLLITYSGPEPKSYYINYEFIEWFVGFVDA